MLKGFTCFEMSFRLMSHSAEGRGLCVHVTVREMSAMEIDMVESFLLFIAKIK